MKKTQIFVETLSFYRHTVQIKMKKEQKLRKPWITSGLLASITNKNRM